MIKTRKEKMLEARIARLERLLKNERKSRKIKSESAGMLPLRMLKQLNQLFEDRLCGRDFWSVGQTNQEFMNRMSILALGEDDETVDEVISLMADDYGYDEEELLMYRDAFTNELANMAAEVCDDVDDDDMIDMMDESCNKREKCSKREKCQDDDEDGEEMEESRCKRRCRESRRFNRRKIRNEDVKRLPNGMTANRVSDVLAGWAGVSSTRPRDAIRELDRQGIIDAATNRWYPSAQDVMDAIEDCWDDPIGAFGDGAAQFFIGNIGGITKCSLTIMPISGGDSRARNITLKFNWPDEMM